MAVRWFVMGKRGEHGPIDSGTLRRYAEEKRISPRTLLRREQDDGHYPAARVPGLFPEAETKVSRSGPAAAPVDARQARKLFFLVEADGEVGPYTIPQLKELADAGELHPGSRVRNIDLEITNSARRIRGLFNDQVLAAYERAQAEKKAHAAAMARAQAERAAAQERERLAAEQAAAKRAAAEAAKRQSAERAAAEAAKRQSAERAAAEAAKRQSAEEQQRLAAERQAAEERQRLAAKRAAAQEQERLAAKRAAAAAVPPRAQPSASDELETERLTAPVPAAAPAAQAQAQEEEAANALADEVVFEELLADELVAEAVEAGATSVSPAVDDDRPTERLSAATPAPAPPAAAANPRRVRAPAAAARPRAAESVGWSLSRAAQQQLAARWHDWEVRQYRADSDEDSEAELRQFSQRHRLPGSPNWEIDDPGAGLGQIPPAQRRACARLASSPDAPLIELAAENAAAEHAPPGDRP